MSNNDEFFKGIWWVPNESGGLRTATLGECAKEIQRLRAELDAYINNQAGGTVKQGRLMDIIILWFSFSILFTIIGRIISWYAFKFDFNTSRLAPIIMAIIGAVATYICKRINQAP
jgi:hypothetical protein